MKLVREVVSRYDIDGVHFDYLRYPGMPLSFPTNMISADTGKGVHWTNGGGGIFLKLYVIYIKV